MDNTKEHVTKYMAQFYAAIAQALDLDVGDLQFGRLAASSALRAEVMLFVQRPSGAAASQLLVGLTSSATQSALQSALTSAGFTYVQGSVKGRVLEAENPWLGLGLWVGLGIGGGMILCGIFGFLVFWFLNNVASIDVEVIDDSADKPPRESGLVTVEYDETATDTPVAAVRPAATV